MGQINCLIRNPKLAVRRFLDPVRAAFTTRSDGSSWARAANTWRMARAYVVPCPVDDTGVHPCTVGRLTPQLAGLNRSNIHVQEQAVRAGYSTTTRPPSARRSNWIRSPPPYALSTRSTGWSTIFSRRTPNTSSTPSSSETPRRHRLTTRTRTPRRRSSAA